MKWHNLRAPNYKANARFYKFSSFLLEDSLECNDDLLKKPVPVLPALAYSTSDSPRSGTRYDKGLDSDASDEAVFLQLLPRMDWVSCALKPI
jgi:hypothetical protein